MKQVMCFLLLISAVYSLETYAIDNNKNLNQELALLKNRLQNVEEQLSLSNQTDPPKPTALRKDKKTKQKDENVATNPWGSIAWEGPDLSVVIVGGASAGYTKFFGTREGFNILDFNPMVLASYRDLLLLHADLDFTIDDAGATNTTLGNLNFNLFLNDYMTFVLGKIDSATGYFVQNLSPSWINRLPDVPVGFDADEAAPQSQIGIELRGGYPLFCESYGNYILFIANGPEGKVNTANNIVDHISTDGFVNNHSNFIFGGRLGVLPIPKLEIGVSGSVGKLALIDMADDVTVLERSRDYDVVGADASYKWNNWDLRAEYINQHIRSQNSSVSPEAETWKAWYLQTAYWIPTTNFEPVVRYSHYATPIASNRQSQWAFGLDYWFTSSLVAQAEYELNHGQRGTDNNTNQFLIQMAIGF